MKDSIAIPVKESLTSINLKNLPKRILFYNFISVAIITAGAFAPIYAGSIAPELRATFFLFHQLLMEQQQYLHLFLLTLTYLL